MSSPQMFLSKSTRFGKKEADMVSVDRNNPGPGAYDKVLPRIVNRSFNKG